MVPLVGKHVVGDALFHVVGLAGEYRQGGILRLPPEARDIPSITTEIELPRDAQRCVLLRLSRDSTLEIGVRNALHHSAAVCGRRYAENDVVISHLRGKVRLRQDATRRIRAPLNREEIVYAAVRCSVRIEHEACLPNRTICGNEGWDHVCGAHRVRICYLWIGGRARTADGGVYVAIRTGKLIEARS